MKYECNSGCSVYVCLYVRLNVDVETRRWQQSISTYVKMAESKWLPKISMDTKSTWQKLMLQYYQQINYKLYRTT